jgi:acyl-CoA dehydrogenase
MQEILANLPNKWMGRALRVLIMPFGKPRFENLDVANKSIVKLFTSNSSTRSRLVHNVFISKDHHDGVGMIEYAFQLVVKNQDLLERLHDASKTVVEPNVNTQDLIQKGLQAKIFDHNEAKILAEIDTAISNAISVDSFTLESLGLVNETEGRYQEFCHLSK